MTAKIKNIFSVTNKVFHQLKRIAKVQPFLSTSSREILVHTCVTCRIVYYNNLHKGVI